MISKKKRTRYKENARQLAEQLGIPSPETWEEIWNFLDKHQEPTYVYVIGEVGGNVVKIGKSKNPGQRLKALQTSQSAKLRLWMFWIEQSPFSEREVHDKLKAHRIMGEWFRVTPEVLTTIEKIRETISKHHKGTTQPWKL